ncbi:hypothetical protein [Alkalibacterium sp.]|nr:MAG: hypothetical protein EA249_09705 [Alkalibacterium sp.]
MECKTRNKIVQLLFISMFSLILLTGCRSNDLFGDDAENVAAIEVREYVSDELVTTITDTSFIESLVQELESANSASTANLDIPNPDYRLLFMDSDNMVIQDIGYYTEKKDYGVVGRYLTSDLHLAVTTELPIEEGE